ncbi:MAG: hypothetical protein ABJF88_14125 [Rhodothermales bacterium]
MMRSKRILLFAISACVVAFAPPSQAQEIAQCQGDWREHFEPDPDLLVYVPEYQPTTESEAFRRTAVNLGSTVGDAVETLTVVRFDVDTLGHATDIGVLCSPSARHAKRARELVRGTEFIPAHDRGRAIRYPMTLPLAVTVRDE